MRESVCVRGSTDRPETIDNSINPELFQSKSPITSATSLILFISHWTLVIVEKLIRNQGEVKISPETEFETENWRKFLKFDNKKGFANY